MSQTANGKAQQQQRKSLANEIDRLDGILDGLDEALAGSVETAVRDVVGQAVRETVEATVREVLSNPELIRAALSRHAPLATPAQQPQQQPRRTPKEALKEKLAALCRKAAEKAAQAGKKLVGAWSWCVEKVRKGCSLLRGLCAAVPACCRLAHLLAHAGACAAWKHRKVTLAALAAGVLAGVGAYFCGPLVASSACGLGGALATAAGIALRPVWKLMDGGGGNG
jgi:hypothetical protein